MNFRKILKKGVVKGGISYLEFELHNDGDYLQAFTGIGRQKDLERHVIILSTT